MNKIIAIIFLLFSFQTFAIERIISASAFATEILYELGLEKNLVAVDLTSTYPPQAKTLPQIGYKRSLSTEGILSLKPSILIVDSSSEPKTVIDAVQSSGVKILAIKEPKNINEIKIEIAKLAQFFGEDPQKTITIIDTITNKIQNNITKNNKSVIFISRHGSNAEFASGRRTVQEEILNILGKVNAITYEGTKPINTEAMATLNADYVIYSTLEELSQKEKEKVKSSIAFNGKKVIFVKSIPLLSFGIASLEEILKLSEQVK